MPEIPYGVVLFQDGREGVTQDVIDRSALLQKILQAAVASDGKRKPSVALPRAIFQFWVQTAVRPPSTHQYLSDSDVIKLIQVRFSTVVPCLACGDLQPATSLVPVAFLFGVI
jgi:hypothetical protein